MNSIIRRFAILIPLAGMLTIAPGCSHQQTAKYDWQDDGSGLSQGQAEDQFLSDVQNLPPDQRKDYVLNHRDELSQLQTDPDKSKLTKLDALLPPDRQ